MNTGTAEVPDGIWFLLLGLILALAFWLRVDGMLSTSLWMDEIATTTMIRLPWAGMIGPVARLEPNPPGYYVLLRLVTAMTGIDDFRVRFPSVVVGALTILPVAAHVGRVSGRVAALVAALLLAVALAHIHYVQQARTYAVLLLATAIAIWAQGRMLEMEGPGWRSAGRACLFGLLCTLMLHLHGTALIIVAALYLKCLVFVVVRPARLAVGLFTHAIAAAVLMGLSAPWLLVVAGIAGDSDSAIAWIAPPDFREALRIGTVVLLGHSLPVAGPFVAGGMVLLAGYAVVKAPADQRAELLGNAAAFVFAILTLYGVSQFVPVLLERTALFLLLFALPLVAHALSVLRPRALAFAILGGLVMSQIVAMRHREANQISPELREDWRGAVAALSGRVRPGDMVVVLGGFEVGALPHYMPERADSVTIRGVAAAGDRLAVVVLEHLARARPFRLAELCELPGPRQDGLWSMGRRNFSDPDRAEFHRGLESLGSRGSEEAFGLIALRRWSPVHCP